MAVGDKYILHSSVNAGAFLDAQPGGSTEIVIHNIYVPDVCPITVERYDGTNSLVFTGTLVGPLILTNLQHHCTNGDRIRVKNTHGSNAYRLAVDGVYTK